MKPPSSSQERPGKEQIRQWLLMRRANAGQPLPDLDAIRRELGWRMAAPLPSPTELETP
jgi:hypothetical protein